MIFINFRSLKVSDIEGIKKEIREHGANFRVIKNSILTKMIEADPEHYMDPLKSQILGVLHGQTAIVYGDGEVTAVCAGPAGAASMLRDALAAGATRAVRVDVDPSLDAAAVAEAVAPVVLDTELVCCGTWSLDRGTGSFPAFLAHRLGVVETEF